MFGSPFKKQMAVIRRRRAVGGLGCASSRGEQGGLDRRPKPPWQARKTPAGGTGFIRHSRVPWTLDGGLIANALAEGRLVLECRFCRSNAVTRSVVAGCGYQSYTEGATTATESPTSTTQGDQGPRSNL